MRIEELSLHNFRLFSAFEARFASGAVAIVGPNASGKTTVLEAVFTASAGRSPRTARDADLVRWGEKAASLRAVFRRGDGRTLAVRLAIEISPSGSRKRIWVGDSPLRRASALLQMIPVVLFTPADLTLAHGEPRVRRRFVNIALARLRAAYADDLARYRRAVLQRNRLLKENVEPAEVAPWTSRLVESGARVAVQRLWFVRQLAPLAAEVHRELSGGAEALEVDYVGDLAAAASSYGEAAEAFRNLLAARFEEERLAGRTLVGPHRDDLRLLIDGRPVRTFGSQGQRRTAALALKLAEARLLDRTADEPPLLLLDDCLSELDASRASAVMELAGRYEQLLITSATDVHALAGVSPAQTIRLTARAAEMMGHDE